MPSLESKVFYFPSREPFLTPAGVRDVEFETPDGVRLHGWLIPGRGSRPPAVLHIHGNAGNIESHAAFSAFVAARGFSVFLFDYRGYGRSGEPRRPLVREDLMIDSRAALEALLARADIDAGRIAVYGVSLGAVFAAALAAERPAAVRATVLVSAFASWRSIANDKVPGIGPLLIRPGLDPIRMMPRLAPRPLLLVHGALDPIIPARHSERLLAAARKAGVPAELLLVPDREHNDMVMDDAPTQDRIVEFLRAALA